MQIQRKSYGEIDRTYFFTATIHRQDFMKPILMNLDF